MKKRFRKIRRAITPSTGPPGEILTLKQVAEYLNCHTSTMYRLVSGGAVPYFRLGGSFRFQKSTIDDWIKGKTYAKARH